MKLRIPSRRFVTGNPKRHSFLNWRWPQPSESSAGRKLRFESLEDRRVLADGDLDALTFSTTATADTPAGVARTNFSAVEAADSDQVQRIGIQSDGKIVAAGITAVGGAQQMALTRYTTAGVLDTTFGGAAMGKVLVPSTVFGATVSTVFVTDMVVTTTDKIVVVGSATSNSGGPCVNGMSSSTDWAIAVFNADGTPDMTFDTDGFKAVDFFTCADNGSSVAVQPADGKILVSGTAFDFQTLMDPTDDRTFLILARFNTDGSPDATFNGGPGGVPGESRFLPPDTIGLNDMVVLPAADPNAGKIISVGTSANGSSFLMNRFTTIGALDLTFDTDGAVMTSFPSAGSATANAVALYTDGTGRIVLAGDVNSGGDFALARYNANGSLDDGTVNDTNMADAFSGDGKFVTDVSSAAMQSDSAKFVGIMSDGKIVATGQAFSPMVPMGSGGVIPSLGIVKLNTDGTLDATFGTGGIKIEHFGDNGMGTPVHQNRADAASAGALQSDGKILVGGAILAEFENDPDFFVARFLNTVVPSAPEIDVQGSGMSIMDGDAAPSLADNTDFGGANVSGGTTQRTFTIANLGSIVLNIDGSPNVQLSGANAADFTVTLQPSDTVAGGGTTTFTVEFNPSALGLRTATITIPSDDADEDPYNFDIQGTGVTPPAAGQLIISEFRVRGPTGANDEFVEIYNNTSSDITVGGVGTGLAVAASDGVVRFVIPNGTIIPAHGHYLGVNSVAYSLASYPAGNGTTATGDATYTTDIPDNAGIALFNTSVPADFTLANRLDAVGSTSEANTLYKEGVGYPALSFGSINYSFFRDPCGKGGSITTFGLCPADGVPKDTNNNAADFVFVDTNGSNAGAGQRLGAPGPENHSSPIAFDPALEDVARTPLDECVGISSPPNRVRDFTSDPANNSTFGTIEFRRTFTNNTGDPLTRLRFRIIDLTTFPAPSGIADLRPRTSSSIVVTVDRAPCGSGTSNVTAQATTLEQPPSQPNGGGFNSSWSAGSITLATPLSVGASIDLRFLFGIQQTGAYKFGILLEGLPETAHLWQLEGNTEELKDVELGVPADLQVAKTDTPDPVAPGANLTYTITLTNAGPGDAQSVSVTDMVPANTTFVSFAAPAGFAVTTPPVGGTGAITATNPTFAPGTATFELVVAVDAGTPDGSIISNTATVTSTTTDPNPANNTDTETTTVEAVGLPECEVITLNSPGDPGTATLEDDADNSGSGVLIVTGTSGNDVIVIEPRPRNAAQLRVTRNGQMVGLFDRSSVQHIVVFGLQGNDKIVVNGSLSVPATLFGDEGNDQLFAARGADGLDGGTGNDRLFGGSNDDTLCGGDGNDFVYGQAGNDFAGGDAGNDKVFGEGGNDFLLGNDGNDNLYGGTGNDRAFGQAGNDQIYGEAGSDIGVGGDGNDKLFGGSGRDVLIGGDGLDTLFGDGHDDILVAGPTIHDEDDEALQAILAEWTSANSYTTRVNNIRNGGGANGAFVLGDTTVIDDGLKDTLWGDGGLDWFLFGDGDKLRDKANNETVN